MGLKFRRGTTAQQSGSLAFGEPYVNTTLGTLVIGGQSGDIVLSSGGTGSTGNFGAISGSGLDITGNANIAGNLTLGGAITIGDASADTVNVVASLSSSLIPSVTNAFDLGSETKFWRDLYISTGSIKFVGAGNAIVGTLTNSGNGMALDGGVIARGDSTFGTSSLAVTSVTGSLAVNGRIIATSITGAIAATNGVVSGSSQVIGILDSLNTYTGSNDTTNTSQNTSITNLNSATASLIIETTNLELFSGSANTRFTEIGVVSGSLISSASAAKTTNDSQDVSITNINLTTASLNTSVANLNTTTASLNTSVTNLNTYTSSLKTALSLSGADLTVLGNLTVQGDTTTLNTSNLLVEDKLIELAIGTTTSAGANGAGIFISGANASILWDDANSTLDINKSIDIVGNITLTGNVDGVDVSVLNSNINTTTASLNTSVSNLNTFSGSANTRFTEIGVVSGSLITSASAAKTTNDSQGVSITNINSTTASLNTSVTNINLTTASLNTSVSNLNTATSSYETKGRSIVSGSAQIDGSLLGSNKTITIGSTSTTLGGTSTTIAGLTSVTSTAFVGALTGNASTATTAAALTTARTINGTSFDGSANITILNLVSGSAQIDGAQLGANKTITIGSTTFTLGETRTTIAGLTSVTSTGFTGTLTGNASTATTAAALTNARTINGTSFDGSANITIPNLVSGSAQVTLSSTTGGTTSSNVQFNSLGIGMAASATAGRIDATNDIVAFSSSDIRFKENITPIENALDKISKISGNTYDWKAENKAEHGYEGNDVGVIAQEIEAVLPQLVQTRENGYKAVKYDKLVALLIEGIKEQQIQIEKLRMDLDNYECKCDNCKSE